MKRLVLAVAVLGVACSSPPPQPKPVCQVIQTPPERYLVAGQAADVTVGIQERCTAEVEPANSFHRADEVIAAVFDPDDQPVAFTISATTRSAGGFIFANTAVVSFDANRPGLWRVTARFEPGIGQTTQSLRVAEWHGAAPVRVVQGVFSDECTQYGLLASGTTVCATPGGLVTQNGQTLLGSRFAIGSNAVWATSDGVVERFVEDGGAFVRTHHLVMTLHDSSSAVPPTVATDDDLWTGTFEVHDPQHAFLVRLHAETDGGLTPEQKEYPDSRLRVLSGSDAGIHLLRSSISANLESVVTAFFDGGQQSSPVSGFSTASLFADGEAFWAWNGNRVTGSTLENGVLLQASLPPLDGGVNAKEPTLSPSAVVVMRYVPRVDGSRIALEAYDAGPGFGPVISATAKHAFARSLDKKAVKVFDR